MGVWAALTALISSGIVCIGDAPAEAASCPKLPVYFLANGFSLLGGSTALRWRRISRPDDLLEAIVQALPSNHRCVQKLTDF